MSISFHKSSLLPQTKVSLALDVVDFVSDLGDKFSFNLHIDDIIIKAFKMLGFIKRSTYFIQDAKALKYLYFSLVKNVMGYTYKCVTWAPIYKYLVDRLEREK